MRLAILMSNTDESAFAQSHPKDGEKWQTLLRPHCPACDFSVYSVKDGEFPVDASAYDGLIITGSPASVHDVDPWLDRLFTLIRSAVAQNIPLFGACFGHQAIALALGGRVADNPGGWVFGVTQTQISAPAPWMADHAATVALHAAHIEQVTRLPKGAQITMGNNECPFGGFIIANQVFTTQYHPEITAPFMTALIDAFEDQKPRDVIQRARASMVQTTDNAVFAQWILAFFRQAQSSAARRSITVT